MLIRPAYFDERMKPPLGSTLDRNHPLARGLVGCWLMNEGGGKLVNDLSGNGMNGTITGATWGLAPNGPCLRFDGNQDYWTVSRPPGIRMLKDWSLSLWFFNPAAQSRTYLAQETDVDGYSLTFSFENTKLAIGYNDGSSYYWASGTIAYARWYHAVAVHHSDKSNELWINGIKQTGTSSTWAPSGAVASTLTFSANSLTYAFAGSEDNGALFSRVLSDSEIAQLYREPFGMFRRPRIELWTPAFQGAGGNEYTEASSAGATAYADALEVAAFVEAEGAFGVGFADAAEAAGFVEAEGAFSVGFADAAEAAGFVEAEGAFGVGFADAAEAAGFVEAEGAFSVGFADAAEVAGFVEAEGAFGLGYADGLDTIGEIYIEASGAYAVGFAGATEAVGFVEAEGAFGVGFADATEAAAFVEAEGAFSVGFADAAEVAGFVEADGAYSVGFASAAEVAGFVEADGAFGLGYADGLDTTGEGETYVEASAAWAAGYADAEAVLDAIDATSAYAVGWAAGIDDDRGLTMTGFVNYADIAGGKVISASYVPRLTIHRDLGRI